MEVGCYFPLYNRKTFGKKPTLNSCLEVLSPNATLSHPDFDEFVIVRMAAPPGHWMLSVGRNRWGAIWNAWFANAMKLPDNEILYFRFHACEISSIRQLDGNTSVNLDLDFDHHLKNVIATHCFKPNQLPDWVCRSRLAFMTPWFIPAYCNYHFMFTDLIFIQTPILSGPFFTSVLTAAINSSGDRCSQAVILNSQLDPNTAIILSTSNGLLLCAVPWTNQHIKTKKQVNRYCRQIFKWMERRCADTSYEEKCPGQVLFSPDPNLRLWTRVNGGRGQAALLASQTIDWDIGQAQTGDAFLDLTKFFGVK
jgi:hypothetical protein